MFDFGLWRKGLLWVLLAHAGVALWRAVLAVQQADFLASLEGGPSPWYIATMGIVWTLVFGLCALMVARRVRFAPVAAILAGVFQQAHVWFDRLFFSRSTESMQTLGFAALLSATFLIALCLPAALLSKTKK